MAKSGRKSNNTETTDSYASEGLTYGIIVGVIFFIVLTVAGQISYGAVFLVIAGVVGLIIGMSSQKPVTGDEQLAKDIESYKKMDKDRNAFFPDMTVKSYDKRIKYPVIRKNLANGERIAGFMNRTTGKFEEKMLIRDERDLKNFMRRYGIKTEEDIGK